MAASRWVSLLVLAACANDDALYRIELQLELRVAEQQEIAPARDPPQRELHC